MSKRTFQPNNRRRAKTHGFRARMATKNGRLVLEETTSKGKKATYSFPLLRRSVLSRFVWRMRNYLRDPTEFQHVYKNGKRYDGKFITVFVIRNQGLNHRLGVTASKKAIGKAVSRNRAKRLLRETFRFNEITLQSLSQRYDWVSKREGDSVSGQAQLAG